MEDLDVFIGGFVVESRENLSRFERDLVDLEKHPSSKETLDSAFRAIHNLKSAAGFLGLEKLEAVSHAGESLLSSLRSGAITLNPPIANALLALVDYATGSFAVLESSGGEPSTDHTALDADRTQCHWNRGRESRARTATCPTARGRSGR
jgi:two-component system, chemotaxis family, sensor kinase CheA